MSASEIRYSVVAPVFNEEDICQELCQRISDTMEQTGEAYEVIIVDDGSTDQTLDVLIKESKNRDVLKIVQLSRNFGQEPAICAGLKIAAGREIILIDGDLQDPPEVILDLIAKKKDGFQVVFGKKKNRKEGLIRRALTRLFYLLMHFFSQVQFPIDVGVFSLMDREVSNWLLNFSEPNKHVSGLRSYIGFRQCAVEYERAKRPAGREKNLYQLVRMGLNAFFAFSMFPLRFSGVVLFIIVLWGGLIFAQSALMFSQSRPEAAILATHFEFFIVACLVVFALTFAVISEYVGRSFEMSKQRPSFIIASVVAGGEIQPISANSKFNSFIP